jgi:HTH-type transcriptional regulator/antitoxin HigA
MGGMMMTTKEIIPFKATHPGLVLKDELIACEISQKEFAHRIKMQPSMLNEIIKGKRAITAEIALILEKSLDIPADFWMNFQTQYEFFSQIKKQAIE